MLFFRGAFGSIRASQVLESCRKTEDMNMERFFCVCGFKEIIDEIISFFWPWGGGRGRGVLGVLAG